MEDNWDLAFGRLVRQAWQWEREKRWFRLVQDDQDDHPNTPIIILGIRMTFGGGGGGLSSGAEGMQPIILVTRMSILFFIYQYAMAKLGKCPGTLWAQQVPSRGRSAWIPSQDGQEQDWNGRMASRGGLA